MKTDKQGCSTCPMGQERYESFRSAYGRDLVQYDYRTPDGELFSTVAKTLEQARGRRDQWLSKKGGAE